MSFVAGETFLYPVGTDEISHLWIIATTPNKDGMFAVVSLTSLKNSKDQTVILREGEHPFIRWDTCVAYWLADLISSEQLQDRLDCGIAQRRAPLDRTLLKLVVAGFTASQFTKRRVAEFVRYAR